MNLRNEDLVYSNGYVVGTKVPSLSQYAYFEVGRTNTSVRRIDAYGKYAHAKTKINNSYSFSVSTSLSIGFSMSTSVVESFDYQHNTQVTIKF